MHKQQKKVLFTATVDSHILAFHLPFLKWFKEQGYEVHVATNGDEEIPYCDKKIKISFERSPFKLNNIKAIFQLKKILLKEKYDIIHTHTPMGSVVTRLAAKKVRKQGTRVIYTAHGFHFYKGAPLLNWLIFYPVEKYLSKYTDTLILINKEDYNLAKKKFKKCKDIEYVPGVGIDEKKFDIKITKEDKHKLRQELGLKDTDFVMIYPAELNKNKNQIMLINAMKQLSEKYPDIHLLLPGKDSYNGYYQKVVQENGLDKNIHFLGFRKDIPRLLKISDLAVATSKREGLPVNIMEAMYVGLPIVATDCRGQRNLIDDGKNGFLTDFSSQKLANKIAEIYNNKKISNRMIKNSHEKIKEYTLNSILGSMANIYNKKKKILHLLASNKFSGAENVVCTIIETMGNKYDMTYCCPHGPIDKILQKNQIHQHGITSFTVSNIKKVIKEYNPDIIHAHDFKASCITFLLKNNSKVVSHIHQLPKWFTTKNAKTRLYNFCSKRFDKIIFVSNSIYEQYAYNKNIKDKVNIIFNFIDKDKVLKLSKESFNKEYDLCFFGRLSSEKNPLEFINIVEEYKKTYDDKIKACMIGTGDLRKKCEDVIKERKLDSNIELLGFQENPYKIVKKCKMVIMPSIYEGFGLAAIESAILNKPVLNSGIGGLEEIFKNNLELVCNSIGEYVKKSKYLLSTKTAKQYDKIAKQYINQENWERKFVELYESSDGDKR